MKNSIEKYTRKITGTIGCFDRIIFKGCLPISWAESMEGFMAPRGLLIKDFKTVVLKQSERVKQHGKALAEAAGRPYIHLTGREGVGRPWAHNILSNFFIDTQWRLSYLLVLKKEILISISMGRGTGPGLQRVHPETLPIGGPLPVTAGGRGGGVCDPLRRNWRGAAGVQVEGERAGNMGDGKEDGTGWGEAGAGEGFYRWHVRAAVVRSVASFALWLSCLGAYGIGLVHRHNLIADTLAVSFLILMNPPVLWVLKRLRKRKAAEAFAIVINGLEIVGYTAVIHALGGIEAAYLLIIYAALIVYVGMWGVGYRPFLVAGMCSLSFAALVTLEHTGVLTPLRINPDYVVTWPEQLGIVSVTAPLLFIVAFISAYTARIIHHSGETLRLQKEALEEALRKAQESDRLKAEFLANVSHELRTPLNAILGFSELLKEGVFGPLNEKQQESLGDILDSGRHLLTLVNDLLDLNKVEAGRMELVPSQTNLRGLIEEGLHVFQEKAGKRGQSLMADLAECPATLQADERRLRQIVYNLLSNALKFTPAGGEIRLSARELGWEEGGWRSPAGEAVVLPVVPGEEGMDQRRIVEIRVADTGIGIKAQDLERIFNPFEQADGSMTRRYEGTGLGLALTRRFVEMHGGRVWAESGGENRGSVFHVVLPL